MRARLTLHPPTLVSTAARRCRLVLLLLSMWRFVDWNIAVAPGDASTTHGSATSLAVAPGAASASHGSASGLAAEAVARAQQAQQAQ